MPPPGPDHQALLALLGSDLVGMGTYEISPEGTAAELALAVADDMHGRGVGTLLLEHLVSDASAAEYIPSPARSWLRTRRC